MAISLVLITRGSPSRYLRCSLRKITPRLGLLWANFADKPPPCPPPICPQKEKTVQVKEVLPAVCTTDLCIQKKQEEFFRPSLSPPCRLGPCMNDPTEKDVLVTPGAPVVTRFSVEVIVIGAGIAGLSAADQLIKSGMTNVKILEAGIRPGGRIRSQWMRDSVVELGAEKSKQAKAVKIIDNTLVKNAMLDGFIKYPLANKDPSLGLWETADGQPIPNTIALRAYKSTSQILRESESRLRYAGPREKGRTMEYIGIRMQQELRKYSRETRDLAARVMTGLVIASITSIADPSSLVLSDDYGAFAYIPGTMIQVPLGLMGMMSPLLQTITPDRIKYGKRVQMIQYGAVPGQTAERAIVTCSDGTTYTAHFVIVAIPLGVIKKFQWIFSPELTASKMQAIMTLKNEHVNKVFLEYDQPFWAWRETPIKISREPKENPSSWQEYVTEIREVAGSNHILKVIVSGDGAKDLEYIKTPEVLKVLGEMVKNKICGAPMPKSMLKSGWSSDFKSLGAYSAVDECAGDDAPKALQTPIPSGTLPPILFFAGDATSATFNGELTGAKLSGIREADRVVSVVKEMPFEEDLNAKCYPVPDACP